MNRSAASSLWWLGGFAFTFMSNLSLRRTEWFEELSDPLQILISVLITTVLVALIDLLNPFRTKTPPKENEQLREPTD